MVLQDTPTGRWNEYASEGSVRMLLKSSNLLYRGYIGFEGIALALRSFRTFFGDPVRPLHDNLES